MTGVAEVIHALLSDDLNMLTVQYALRTSARSLKHAAYPLAQQSLRFRYASIPPCGLRLIHTTQSLRIPFTTKHAHSLQDSRMLQFLSNKIRYATHRSRNLRPLPSSSSYRSAGRSPPNFDSDGPPRQVVFWGILALNGLVYLAWQRAYFEYVRDHARCLSVNSLAECSGISRHRTETLVCIDGWLRTSPSA